jgi:hypothetical protein
MSENNDIINKAILGVVSPTGGIVISTMTDLEQWLRISSLVVGIIVGIVSIAAIIRKKGK